MRMGIFGGTFNPIHFGHLRSAEEVREEFALDRIYFVPSADPPHKAADDLVASHHRMRMVEIAMRNNAHFFLSAVEIEREGKSYSVDTVRHFLTAFAADTILFFIIGLDAFREIHTWKEYHSLFSLCHVIVTSRPSVGNMDTTTPLPVALQDQFYYDESQKRYVHSSHHSVFFYRLTPLDISASDIRRRLRNRQSIKYLVPQEVEDYIRQQGLYVKRDIGH